LGGKGSGGTAGRGSGGSAGTIGEAGAGGAPDVCERVAAPPAPLRRLSRFQYDNAVRDLFGDMSRPAQRLPYDTWTDIGDDLVPDPVWVPGFHELAHDFAVDATRSPAALTATLGCDPEVDGEAACRTALIDALLPRIFRQPLSAEDVEEFERLFDVGRAAGGDTFGSGVRMVLEVALQSPEFLYRAELGEPLDLPSSDPRSGWGRPTPFEMASRLSFLLWGSTPDPALLSQAAAGGLRTKEEVRTAAETLLEDERSRDVIRYFHERLLALRDAPFPASEDPSHPAFTAEIAALFRSETTAFLDDVGSSGPGGFAALVSAPFTYLNEPLAAYYGIPGVTGPDLRQVSLSSPPYAGILTQGSFLAANSLVGHSAPSLRGFRIAKGLFCLNVVPEPVLVDRPLPEGVTTREWMEAAVSEPSCAGCHHLVDPIGYALEHFDQAGRYRDTEVGKPIDAAAEITLLDGTHSVDGAADLGRLIAESPEAHACYVTQWAAYAYGNTADLLLDACSRAALTDAFERSNGDIRAVLLELTQTDAFLYLPLTEP
jgi:hypothetical protein